MASLFSSSEHPLILALQRIDPLLVFLTKASGHVSVPLPTLKRALPSGMDADAILENLKGLVQAGILCLQSVEDIEWDNENCRIGFPPPPSHGSESKCALHGSSKTAAKRRLAALKRMLRNGEKFEIFETDVVEQHDLPGQPAGKNEPPAKEWDRAGEAESDNHLYQEALEEPINEEEKQARLDLIRLLGFREAASEGEVDGFVPCRLLPRQLSYAGTHSRQESVFQELSAKALEMIPMPLREAFGLNQSSVIHRNLYRHQALAIESALADNHTVVCTGTGSGKSLCFLIPVLTSAYCSDCVSLVLFPTKALAQDQLSKLNEMLARYPSLGRTIRPAALDGDCPHNHRVMIADTANVILTNPDTLHAAILPTWRRMYRSMLARIQYVVLDELHMYGGVFGAHVAMILSRLARVQAVAAHEVGRPLRSPTFLAASATLPWPEQMFRKLCPISSDQPVTVLGPQQDGSPRSAKHFFVWNPPVLNLDGSSTGKVIFPVPVKNPSTASLTPSGNKKRPRNATTTWPDASLGTSIGSSVSSSLASNHSCDDSTSGSSLRRRHAADETALLLARAVAQGVRCIVFCKTRNLVEWVFERAIAALARNPQTAHLIERVESYRGGYSMVERRKIEQRLFKNELMGVVGTNALELGVDIGGVDLTLHCGYPSSHTSLLQQAGRAGRGVARLEKPSCSVVVCFNSAAEQHLWRHPKSLFGHGVLAPYSIPIRGGLLQGHLLCASEEFPLTGEQTLTSSLGYGEIPMIEDMSLFGGKKPYDEAVGELLLNGSLRRDIAVFPNTRSGSCIVLKAQPSLERAASRVNIRSIEPVNYQIVNMSHPLQRGRCDRIHDEGAVLDTMPYSRVFYHAHPGAIITHRGRKYEVVAMTSPPSCTSDPLSCKRDLKLAAFSKPTNAKYATRPLSNTSITVIKLIERAELVVDPITKETRTFAGTGMLTVKRTVHGYKKISLVTRAELSRSELILPPMEFDTYGIWLDTSPETLELELGHRYGPGVHALAHAMLAVAPVIAPGVVRDDIECDHSFYAPTRITLFDERAGGSGSCENLWNLLFRPNSLLDAALDLLQECSSCSADIGYDGGCPACLHAANCIKFNMHLSRSAGAVIAKHLIRQLKETDLYRESADLAVSSDGSNLTPRRLARSKALGRAKVMHAARQRQYMVGRPSWPLDGDENVGRLVEDE